MPYTIHFPWSITLTIAESELLPIISETSSCDFTPGAIDAPKNTIKSVFVHEFLMFFMMLEIISLLIVFIVLLFGINNFFPTQ